MSLTKLASELAVQLKEVAKAENLELERIHRGFKKGSIALPFNPIHSPKPLGIGSGLRVKINANIGASPDYANLEEELEKAKIAIEYKTDTLMDLSIGGDINLIRKKILKSANIPVGTVPIYQAGIEFAKKSAIVRMTEDSIFNAIERHAKDGVDFMTLHCGITKESIEKLRVQKRVTGVVSRGGAFLVAWMLHNQKENPLYKNYDYLLELAEKYSFTISLGDGLRPGCIADASDRPQIQELIIVGELVERAREKGVQVIVEGPGHVPLNQIEANVRMEKAICKNAPFYVLGPLVTDIAPGYDHLVGAIGGALAAYYGADFLCYVTPGEHLALPSVNDVKEGVIASRIAAHVADLARGKNYKLDLEMAKARFSLNWKKQFELAVDSEKAKEYRRKRKPQYSETCSMCGKYCAMRIVKEYLE
ncbi:MAG: phosphomethylpyrimidine synthase [Candidatus Thermoplasmatota archaeon]|nr:phosphomethylpyrimidine synthase [Candidatus Thermoplasmatota archaeon]